MPWNLPADTPQPPQKHCTWGRSAINHLKMFLLLTKVQDWRPRNLYKYLKNQKLSNGRTVSSSFGTTDFHHTNYLWIISNGRWVPANPLRGSYFKSARKHALTFCSLVWLFSFFNWGTLGPCWVDVHVTVVLKKGTEQIWSGQLGTSPGKPT